MWKKISFAIFAALAISTAFAAIPMEPDALLSELVSEDELVGINCRKTCYKDKCYGTLTNPVPWGKQWFNMGTISNSGCCFLRRGKCQQCCETCPSSRKMCGGRHNPRYVPTRKPTRSPTRKPTRSPTLTPTERPTAKPTFAPTEKPTTKAPSPSPSSTPTEPPTPQPTKTPTEFPTFHPTRSPTDTPTEPPTHAPTMTPTEPPTTRAPSPSPSSTPTEPPTQAPTMTPTDVPSTEPTAAPTTSPTEKQEKRCATSADIQAMCGRTTKNDCKRIKNKKKRNAACNMGKVNGHSKCTAVASVVDANVKHKFDAMAIKGGRISASYYAYNIDVKDKGYGYMKKAICVDGGKLVKCNNKKYCVEKLDCSKIDLDKEIGSRRRRSISRRRRVTDRQKQITADSTRFANCKVHSHCEYIKETKKCVAK